jgi:hypothetical protein
VTARKVVDLHPPTEVAPGAFSLRWDAERTPATRRWAVVGRIPGRTHGLAAVIEVKFHPGGVTAGQMARKFAQFANDSTEESA